MRLLSGDVSHGFCGVLLSSLFGCMLLGCGAGQSARYTDYRVKKGDTLLRIAERYGVTVGDILAANESMDPRRIEIGRQLRVPIKSPEERRAERAEMLRAAQKINRQAAKEYSGRLAWPTDSEHITSSYGSRGWSNHRGIDIAGERLSYVRATHDGVVVFSGRFGNYGNLIAIKGEGGLLTMYGHNHMNLSKAGDRVRQGDVIAELGATGNASGPHLHYEVRVKDSDGKFVPVNPLAFYK